MNEVGLEQRRRLGWRHRLRQRYTDEHLKTLVDKIERAAEVAALSAPEAEANRKNSEAIAKLADALSSAPNAAILSGSILLLKGHASDGSPLMVGKTLSASELRRFEEDERWAENLVHALDSLRVGRALPRP